MNEKVVMGIRILFGVFCLIFGLNKFLGFIPFPPIDGDGGTLMSIYFTSGFLKIIGVLEIVFGLALIINKYVPLSLTILIAIMFNAFIFHALHDMAGIGGAVLGMILGLLLVYANKDRFKDLLSA
ncbi:MAG: DoxX family protein [Bacteroidota bacterium]